MKQEHKQPTSSWLYDRSSTRGRTPRRLSKETQKCGVLAVYPHSTNRASLIKAGRLEVLGGRHIPCIHSQRQTMLLNLWGEHAGSE